MPSLPVRTPREHTSNVLRLLLLIAVWTVAFQSLPFAAAVQGQDTSWLRTVRGAVVELAFVVEVRLDGDLARLYTDGGGNVVLADNVVQIAEAKTFADLVSPGYILVPSGSGTIVSQDGLILTNHHVINADGLNAVATLTDSWHANAKGQDSSLDSHLALTVLPDEFGVLMKSDPFSSAPPEIRYFAAVATDSSNNPVTSDDPDVAVLRITQGQDHARFTGDFRATYSVTVGNSDQISLDRNNSVTVFGYPGVLADLDQAPGQITGITPDRFVSNAEVAPGNSGGAAVDPSGALVGIPTGATLVPCLPQEDSSRCAVLGDSFAQILPINRAKELLERADWKPPEDQPSPTMSPSPPTPLPIPELPVISAPSPTLTLSSESVRKGEPVTVTGAQFQANEMVDILLHATLVKQVQADANGAFSTTIVVPPDAPPPGFGTSITAIGQTSGRPAHAPFRTAP